MNYAHGNLSVTLSFPTTAPSAVFRQVKNIKNHVIIMQNQTNPQNLHSDDLIAIDSSTFSMNNNSLNICQAKYLAEHSEFFHFNRRKPNKNNKHIRTESQSNNVATKNIRGDVGGLYGLTNLGYFPNSINITEPCKNEPNHLCLNMLDEHVAGMLFYIDLLFFLLYYMILYAHT